MNLPTSLYVHETPSGLIACFDSGEGQVLGLYGNDGVLIEEITADRALSLIAQGSGHDQTLAKAHKAA